jgi:hypothetical protein
VSGAGSARNFPDLATCLESSSNSLDIDGLRADVDAGVIDYDAEAARRCIDLFSSLITCELTVTGERFRDLERTCAAAFIGTVADGDSCTEDEQCAGFLADCETESCPDQCCAGVCATPPELADAEIGESCAAAPCVNGAYCDETQVCAQRIAIGDACTEFDSCVEGALCDAGGSGTCFALAGPGETCDPAGAFGFSCLRTDNYCDVDTEVCTERINPGESCSVELQNCVNFAFCDAGTCATRPGAGDACTPDAAPDWRARLRGRQLHPRRDGRRPLPARRLADADAVERRRVAGLVDPELRAARQLDRGDQAPALIADLRARHALCPHRVDELLDVLAHQIELVLAAGLGRVHGDLGGRQREDQPTVAGVGGAELEDIA